MRALVLAAVLALSSAAAAARMTISVPDFSSGRTVPMANVLNLFGCTGQNQSPAISWSGEPRGTQSFAVTVFDPDAPTGSGWWHWTVFDIPANVHSLPAGAGDQGATTLPAVPFKAAPTLVFRITAGRARRPVIGRTAIS